MHKQSIRNSDLIRIFSISKISTLNWRIYYFTFIADAYGISLILYLAVVIYLNNRGLR